jgi:uncharacterized membrane protein
METTFKGYRNALGINHNMFKGGLKWFIFYCIFNFLSMHCFNISNGASSLICTLFYTAGFSTAVQIYNSNVNPPLVTTTLALSNKRRATYIYLETLSNMAYCSIFIVAASILISLINHSYIPTVKPGDFIPVIFSIAVPFTFLPLTFVANKKRWKGLATVIAIIFGAIFIALVNLADDSHKFIHRTDLCENFSSIPNCKLLFIAICASCVAIVAASYLVTIRFANKKYHLTTKWL